LRYLPKGGNGWHSFGPYGNPYNMHVTGNMQVTGREFAASPMLYPLQLDDDGERMFLARLTEADYRSASFLDERGLSPAHFVGWAPSALLVRAAEAIRSRPLHFIFHTGHAGSTLLSRLLDQRPGVLGLREPLPLRTIADAAGRLDALLPPLLRIWARGFADTEAAVVKATSTAGRLAPQLLATLPMACAIYLYLKAEPTLATMIAGIESVKDQAGFVAERTRRITALLGDDSVPQPESPGEFAALAFLAENLARAEAQRCGGDRVLALNFEDVLADLPGTLARVFAHFGLAMPAGRATDIAAGAVAASYSKAPDQPYSTALRAAVLDEARQKAGGEIAHGLRWLEAIAARHKAVAVLLT
jgi:hypothetical protein